MKRLVSWRPGRRRRAHAMELAIGFTTATSQQRYQSDADVIRIAGSFDKFIRTGR